MKYFSLNYCTLVLAVTLLMLGKVYGQAGISVKEITTADAASKLLQPIDQYLNTADSWEWTPINRYTWKNTSIKASDIAFGGKGHVWRVDVNGLIFRWMNNNWQRISGTAVRIAVDLDGSAWIVNKTGEIHKYNLSKSAWEIKPGSAQDIGIGADGSVWIVGKQGEIFKLETNAWTRIPGVATRIAVDAQGIAWVVNAKGDIFQFNGTRFIQVGGIAIDIAIANRNVYVVGTDKIAYAWDSGTWKALKGLKNIPLQNISGEMAGILWGIASDGTLYEPVAPEIDNSDPSPGFITQTTTASLDNPPVDKNITITQSGGYVASVKLTYTQNGQTITAIDQGNLPIGWQKVSAIPGDATQIKLLIRNATGVVWDPWKTVIEKTWDKPTDVCIKVYGTTLDPKWNNDCK